jgi:hypothetical protein
MMTGFRLKFSDGMITGYGTSAGKAYASYAKTVEGAMRLEFHSMINLDKKAKVNQQCKFGLNVNVGMM